MIQKASKLFSGSELDSQNQRFKFSCWVVEAQYNKPPCINNFLTKINLLHANSKIIKFLGQSHHRSTAIKLISWAINSIVSLILIECSTLVALYQTELNLVNIS